MARREIFNNYYYWINRRLLMNICLWPDQDRNFKLFVRSFIVISIHSMMIPQIIRGVEELQIKDKKKDVMIITENFAGFLYFQIVLAKYFSFMVVEDKLSQFYEEITLDIDRITDPLETSVLLRTWRIGRLFTVFYTSYTFVGCVCFVTAPSAIPALFDLVLPLNESRPKALCYYGEYYVDEQEYFPYLLLHTFIAVSCTIFILAAVDSTFVAIVYHVLALFNIIKFRVRRVFDEVENKYTLDARKAAEIHTYVVDTVKLHIRTIEFASEIEESFTVIFFYATGAVLMAFSVGTIDLMLNLNSPPNLIRIGFLWVGGLIYLFYTSWPGQQLVDQSQCLLEEVYSAGWYNLPQKTKILIRFMMMRCLVPSQLTAGPFMQMNFANCGMVLKTALSYFTVVYSFS